MPSLDSVRPGLNYGTPCWHRGVVECVGTHPPTHMSFGAGYQNYISRASQVVQQ